MSNVTNIKPMHPSINQKQLTNVFIAMRTDFFGLPDEHVTLKYYNEVPLSALMGTAARFRQLVPTEIKLDGFANWQGANSDTFYEVGLIHAFDNPLLFSTVRTPHVTIRKAGGPVSNATFDPRLFGEPQVIDSLWVGKKSKGKFIWMPIENEPIMDTAVRGWEIFGSL